MNSMAVSVAGVLVLVLTGAAVGGVGGESDGFLHHAYLDSRGSVRLWWTPEEHGILFRLQVNSLDDLPGYVSVGISPNGGMMGADMAIAMLDGQGSVNLVDAYAEGNQRPVKDDQQDVILISSRVESDSVQVTFRRHESCDLHDVPVTVNTAVHIIWSFGQLDPSSKLTTYHQNNRGVRLINLHRPNSIDFTTEEEEQNGLQYIDILAPAVAVPDKQTFYHCHITKLQPFPRKSHFVGYKVIIEEGHEGLVHHIIVYECSVPEDRRVDFEDYISSEKRAQCYSPNMPADWKLCKYVFVAWAVGGGGERLPENVGVPMHEQHGGATYFMTEIHYNNPQQVPDLVDSSGVRLYYTEQLRQYEAGMMMIGHRVLATQFIPPRQASYRIVGLCSFQCTEQLPTDGISVYSVLLHAHLAGVQIRLHHIAANGRQLAPLASDPAYDFNYQQTWRLSTPVRVMPGDQLLVECVYDTSGRDNVTFAGLSTNSEMCLAFLGYYPRVPLTTCRSTPDMVDLLQALDVHTVELDGETILVRDSGDALQSSIDQDDQTNPDKNDGAPKTLSKSVREQLIQLPDTLRGAFLQLRKIGVASKNQSTTSSLFEFLVHRKWEDKQLQRLQEAIATTFRPKCRFRDRSQQLHGRQTVTGVQFGVDHHLSQRCGKTEQVKSKYQENNAAANMPFGVVLLYPFTILLTALMQFY